MNRYNSQMITCLSAVCFTTMLVAVSSMAKGEQDISKHLVKFTAAAQAAPPKITLHREKSAESDHEIYRKDLAATSWGDAIARLPSGSTSYVDHDITIGMAYEYKITRGPTSSYVCSGINLPVVDYRGKVLLLVDSTVAPHVYKELLRLQDDLTGDGWTVVRRDIDRDMPAAAVRKLIVDEYNRDPSNVKSLFLFGNIAVPYSGNIAPDGHSDHMGAWPADVFYGDVDGVWTDKSVNANNNQPGDGKYDQSTLPSDVDLEVGRVDLTNMESFHEYAGNEMMLYKQYLDKNHNFRLATFRLANRGLIDDNFGGDHKAYSASGWRNFPSFFGASSVISADYFSTLSKEDYLWSYAAGGGSYVSAQGVGNSLFFANHDVKTVFTMLFGSYFGDWNNRNNFLRAALCSKSYVLTSCWAGIPQWFVHHMGIGKTIGYVTRVSQNNDADGSYAPEGDQGIRGVHVALMGDPTLRMLNVVPPSNLKVLNSGGNVTLNWVESTDDLLGYHVYRSDTPSGPFRRLTENPISQTSYLDKGALPGNYTYMVKTIKLEQGTGSYYNASVGIMGSNYAIAIATPPATQPLPVSVRPEPVSGPNLALGAKITVSSSHENSPGQRAVDGDMHTALETTYEKYPIWFTLDLGAVHPITRVEITWGNWDQASYGSPASTGYTLRVSDDGQNWKVAYTKKHGMGGKEVLPLASKARYIRLDSNEHGARYIAVCEFEVFGSGD